MESEVRKKPYAWIVAIIVVAVVFFAGGYFAHSTTTTSTTSKVNVTFYESLAPSESAYFQNTLMPEFQSAHPNITVTFVNLPSGQPAAQIQTMVSSGSVGPSIVGLDNLLVGEVIYTAGGSDVMDLGSMLNSIMPSGLIPSAVNMTNYEQTVFGHTYFVPFRSNIPLVFYNKTAFTNAGVSTPPATWAEMMTAAQKLGTGSVMFQGAANTGTHTGSSTATELYQWMVQAGGNPFVLNDSGDLVAWQYLWNLSAYFNPEYTNGYWGSYAGLARGTYSVLDYQWPYIYSQLTTNASYGMTDQTLGVYPGPSGPVNGNHLLGGDVLVIPKGATHLPQLATLANFLLGAQAQKQTLVNLSWVAVNSAAYQNLPSTVSQVGAALQQAIQTGVFLRNPTPWISYWQVVCSNAFTAIIVDHASYNSIASTLSTYNHQMYTYLQNTYNSSVANNYEAGGYAPISV